MHNRSPSVPVETFPGSRPKLPARSTVVTKFVESFFKLFQAVNFRNHLGLLQQGGDEIESAAPRQGAIVSCCINKGHT